MWKECLRRLLDPGAGGPVEDFGNRLAAIMGTRFTGAEVQTDR